MSSILSGNHDDFGYLISETERLVSQIVFKMILNAEDRKDIIQDVYLKVYNKLSTFKFQSKLSTWVAQICYNTCLNYLTKKKLLLVDDQSTTNENKAGFTLDQLATHTINSEPEAWMFAQDIGVIIEVELEKLSPLYKTLIVLFHNQELSYFEIGEITKLPEGTIKNYLYRARRKLRDNLLKNYKKEDL